LLLYRLNMNTSTSGGVPAEAAELAARAQQALIRRDVAGARALLERLSELQPNNPQPWLQLAMLFRMLKDEASEERVLHRALEADSHDLMALIMRGKLLERQGRAHEAVSAYEGVIAVAPDAERVVAELRAPVQHARDYVLSYKQRFGDFVDRFIAEHGAQLESRELDRFRLSLDIQFGRKKRYDAQPMGYFVPQLLPVEFFERQAFPWLDEIEAATDAIRDEFLGVLAQEEGFTPYLTYGSDAPLNQWAELNNSPRWSAFHLLKDGMPVPANSAKCPRTMQALRAAPQPDQPGRTPVAMFSLLKPRTRIPPHVGISNARLVTHLPLIVPAGCGFRVGNQIREWVPGQAWVFDDTIEHEAWNDSDKLRVVLIFDIWHPALSAAERRAITLLTQAEHAFLGRTGGFDL